MSDSGNLVPDRKLKVSHIIVIGIIVLTVIGWATGGSSSSTQGDSSSTGNVSASSWIPSGFESWDANVAYKWVDNPTCNSYSTCAAIQVVTNKDCPNNLYGELILQDKDYVQYSYTNDSQGSLSVGSTAELTFNFAPDARFANFKLSKISCH
jgi:hypothetical protein